MAYTAQNVNNQKWVVTDDDGETHNIYYTPNEPITEQEAITIAQTVVAGSS